LLDGEQRRTKAIKRGGQHPEWDEEFRFTIYEDVDDIVNGAGTPPPPPPKNCRSVRKIKGGTSMAIACFADDPRGPDLIGETLVDLTEVLTKGETDGTCRSLPCRGLLSLSLPSNENGSRSTTKTSTAVKSIWN